MPILTLSSSFLALNFLTTFCVALVSFLIARKLIHRDNTDWESKSFGLFWLMAVPIWGSAALSSFSLIFNGWDLFMIFESLIRIFVPIEITIELFYILTKIFGVNRKHLYFTFIFGAATIFYLYSVFNNGFEVSKLGNYGADTRLSGGASIVFIILFALPFLLGVYDLFFRLIKLFSRYGRQRWGGFFATFSVILYGCAAFWDELGIVTADWRLMFVRITLLVSVVIAYFCYETPGEKNIVIEKKVM